jgi:hypothetical protein
MPYAMLFQRRRDAAHCCAKECCLHELTATSNLLLTIEPPSCLPYAASNTVGMVTPQRNVAVL